MGRLMGADTWRVACVEATPCQSRVRLRELVSNANSWPQCLGLTVFFGARHFHLRAMFHSEIDER